MAKAHGITPSVLTQEEQEALKRHGEKHKIYPFTFRFRKTVSAGGGFATTDGALGSYFTLTWRPPSYVLVESIASFMIASPNDKIGQFSIMVSYSDVITMADQASAVLPGEEATRLYQLTTNGGAINDFQVFYPLTWYVEANRPLYIHVWADATRVTAADTTLTGAVTFGTLYTGES